MDLRAIHYQLNHLDGTLRSLQAEIGWQGQKKRNSRLAWYGQYLPELEENETGIGDEVGFITAMWVYTNTISGIVEGFELSVSDESSVSYGPLLAGRSAVGRENMSTRQIELPARDRARFTGLKGAVNNDGQIV